MSPRRSRIVTSTVLAGALATLLAAVAATVTTPDGVRVRERLTYHAARLVGTLRTALTADVAPPTDVVFDITPSDTFAISRFIYGANFLTDDGPAQAGFPPWYGARLPDGLTFNRLGGNRLSAYNWRLNASNAGRDYRYQNDRYLGQSAEEGEAVRSRMVASAERGAAMLLTVPMLPYVAGNARGVPLDTLEDTASERFREHFVPNRPSRGPADPPNTVYQDEFIRWVAQTFPGWSRNPAAPPFVSLDNEPDVWHDTHQEIMHRMLGKPQLQTYDGFIGLSLDYARAIKRELPGAVIFGPALATYAGVSMLGRYPTPDPRHGQRPFLEYYLERMRLAETREGKRLLDVVDLHWYPASGASGSSITYDLAPQTAEMVQARLQAPRSLWDSTYDERSWVASAVGGPVMLLPRVRSMIGRLYPGTKLAITEYYFGRAGDISGGLAQADVLGIFGREGVYAAALWPQANVYATPFAGNGERAWAYAFGAFQLYRNYDGAGGRFGDVGVRARTSDPVNSAVYASRDSAGRLVVVAINKTVSTIRATLALPTGAARRAQTWTMQDGAPTPARGADVEAAAGQPLVYAMPPMSATTLVVR